MEQTILEQRTVLGRQFCIYGTVENPLFLAKDVAEWIGHTNLTEMIRRVDENEKLVSPILSAGQHRSMTFLTEDGLYEVLMQSRKPIAKQFKAEVKRILKQIRLKGCVFAGSEQEFVEKTFSALPAELLRQISTHLHAQNREMQQQLQVMDTKVRLMGEEAMALADRTFITAAVRKMGLQSFHRVPDALKIKFGWGMFYRELEQKHHIGLTKRTIDQTTGKQLTVRAPRLNTLRDDELPQAVATIVALCEIRDVDLSDLIQRLQDAEPALVIAHNQLLLDAPNQVGA